MDRNDSFDSGAINARTHPHFFKPPKGAPRPTQSLGDLENAQAYKNGRVVKPSQPKPKPIKQSKVIKPGTIL